MKKLLLAILLLVVVGPPAPAQVIVSGAGRINGGPNLPATCATSDADSGHTMFWLTTGTTGLYTCTATNTWSLVGTAGASGVTSVFTQTGAVGNLSGVVTTAGSTVTAFGSVAARTLIANNTGSAAAPGATTFDSLFGLCTGAGKALTYDTSTHTFGCNTITGGVTSVFTQTGAVANLSGDTTTSGSSVTTTAKVNGVAFPASPSLHASPTVTATNTVTYKVVPDCTDSAGNHLNYTQSTDAYSCGTSSAGGGTAAFAGPYPLENGFPDATGNVFYSSVALTSPFVHAHWEFDKANTVKDLSFRFRYPHTIPSGAAKVVLGNISANDGTASHTMTFKECDKVVSTIENPSGFTCTATQNFTTTSTAYAPSDLTFTLSDTPVADKEVQIYIECTAASGLTNNVLIGGVYLEWQ